MPTLPLSLPFCVLTSTQHGPEAPLKLLQDCVRLHFSMHSAEPFLSSFFHMVEIQPHQAGVRLLLLHFVTMLCVKSSVHLE